MHTCTSVAQDGAFQMLLHAMQDGVRVQVCKMQRGAMHNLSVFV